MRVKILTNLGSRDYPDHELCEGEVADVADSVASVMVKRRHASIIIDEDTPKAPPPSEETRDVSTHRKQR